MISCSDSHERESLNYSDPLRVGYSARKMKAEKERTKLLVHSCAQQFPFCIFQHRMEAAKHTGVFRESSCFHLAHSKYILLSFVLCFCFTKRGLVKKSALCYFQISLSSSTFIYSPLIACSECFIFTLFPNTLQSQSVVQFHSNTRTETSQATLK